MPEEPIDHTFTTTLLGGGAASGWTYAVMLGSRELFGTGRAVKVVATVDGEHLETSLLPMGDGTHMLPVKAALRRRIGKQAGDAVTVHLEKRMT